MAAKTIKISAKRKAMILDTYKELMATETAVLNLLYEKQVKFYKMLVRCGVNHDGIDFAHPYAFGRRNTEQANIYWFNRLDGLLEVG